MINGGNRDAYVDLGIIRQRSKRLVQGLMHLLGISFKETTASCHHNTLTHVHEQKERKKRTPNEQRIPRKHNPLLSILHEKADTILRMTGGMQSLDGDALANLERFPMLRRGSDR